MHKYLLYLFCDTTSVNRYSYSDGQKLDLHPCFILKKTLFEEASISLSVVLVPIKWV